MSRVPTNNERTEVNMAKSEPSAPGPRTVVITGASAGIGRAVARGFGHAVTASGSWPGERLVWRRHAKR